MKPPSSTLLHRHHRRAQWMLSLWIAVAGLAAGAVLIVYEVPLRWRAWAVLATAAVALVFRFWPRRTLRQTASMLDTKLKLNNRLEAVVELDQRADPLAEATRGEVKTFLAAHPWPRPYAWIAGLALFAVLLPVNLAYLIPHSTGGVLAPGKIPMAEVPPPVPAAELPAVKPPAFNAEASITWVKPTETISASPAEEVPLLAELKSKGGLRKLDLHVALNGEFRPPLSVASEIAAGVKSQTATLALAPLEARPADIVTYYLQAEAVRPPDLSNEPALPPVVSTLQIVEVRPFRAEAIPAFDQDDPAGVALQQMEDLKQNQFCVLREAFTLGLTAGAKSPAWREQVRALQARQATIDAAFTALTASPAGAAIPNEAADLLAVAKSEMVKATSALTRSEPSEAVATGTRAASRLAAAEQIVARALRDNQNRRAAQAASEPGAPVPELPSREDTPAGQLERLAAEQQTVAGQLASQTAPADIFQTQDRIARAVAKLAADSSWPKPTAALLGSGAEAAKESAVQLNEKDHLAATEPATRAAQALAEALANVEGRGRERATNELQAAQQALNRAATDLQLAARPELSAAAQKALERTASLQQELQTAARREQERGSAAAAQSLNDLAKRMAASNIRKDLDTLARAGPQAEPAAAQKAADKLRNLAQDAANAAGALQQNETSQEKLIEELRRAQENLERIAGEAALPLRWTKPTSEMTATPAETVSLIAQANSELPLFNFKLHLTLNGNPRPGVAVSTAKDGVGVQAIPVTLALATLSVKEDSVVSYLMSAERSRAATEEKPAGTETIYTPVQLIIIEAAKNDGAKKDADKEPKKNDQAQREDENNRPLERGSNPLREIIDLERDLIGRLLPLQEEASSRRDDATWQAGVARAEKDQHKNLEALQPVLEMVQFLAIEGADEKRKELEKVKIAMTAAEKALKEKNPAAASPFAIKALAGLSKLLSSQNSSSPNPRNQESREGNRANQPQPRPDFGGPPPQPLPVPGLEGLPGVPLPNLPPPPGLPPLAGNQPPPPSGAGNSPQPGGNQPGNSQDPSGNAPPSDPLGPAGSNQMTDLYETIVQARQRSNPTAAGGPPPPPGPGSQIAEIREYAGLLAQHLEGLIQQAQAAENQRKRQQVLTTANPAEAPPAYRPSVEDYFEKLARDRRTPAASAR